MMVQVIAKVSRVPSKFSTMTNTSLHAGIDIGSTTVKLAVLDSGDALVYSTYERHHADIRGALIEIIDAAHDELCRAGGDPSLSVAVTGSGGLSVSRWLDLPFVQEVIAGARAVSRFLPGTDVAIELGGEDAKITYFSGGLEQRMNGTCAGGTGAFIDQMATLLQTDAAGLNALAAAHTTIYPIAARCGVFAKTRRAAPDQRGGAQGGHRGKRAPGGGEPDHLGARLRKANPRHRGFPRRSFAFPAGDAKALREGSRAGSPSACARLTARALRGHGRGARFLSGRRDFSY